MRCHSDRGLVKSSICLFCFSNWVDSCMMIVSDRVRALLKASSALFLASLAASSWDSSRLSSVESKFGLVWTQNVSRALRITSALEIPSESALSVAFWFSSSLSLIVNWENLSAIVDTFWTNIGRFELYYVSNDRGVT